METPDLPTQPYLPSLEADLSDDATFRQMQAQHLIALTLAAQRTEWYLRSIRIMVLIWFVLFIIAAVIGVIMGIVAVTSEPDPEPFRF